MLRAKYGWTKNSDMPAVYVHHSAMANFCMQCSAPLDAKAVMEIEAKIANVVNGQENYYDSLFYCGKL